MAQVDRNEIIATVGVDQRSDVRVGTPGTLRRIENMRFGRDGRLRRRAGLTGAIEDGWYFNAVTTYRDDLYALASKEDPNRPIALIRYVPGSGWVKVDGQLENVPQLPLVRKANTVVEGPAAGEPAGMSVAVSGDFFAVCFPASRVAWNGTEISVLQVQIYRLSSLALLHNLQVPYPRVEGGSQVVTTGDGFGIISVRSGSLEYRLIDDPDSGTIHEATPLSLPATSGLAAHKFSACAINVNGNRRIAVTVSFGNQVRLYHRAAGIGGAWLDMFVASTSNSRWITLTARSDRAYVAFERGASGTNSIIAGYELSPNGTGSAWAVTGSQTDLLSTFGFGQSLASVAETYPPIGAVQFASGDTDYWVLGLSRPGAVELFHFNRLSQVGSFRTINDALLVGDPIDTELGLGTLTVPSLNSILVPLLRGNTQAANRWELWAAGHQRDVVDLMLGDSVATRGAQHSKFAQSLSRGLLFDAGGTRGIEIFFPRTELDDNDRDDLVISQLSLDGTEQPAITQIDGRLAISTGGTTMVYDGATLAEFGFFGRPSIEDGGAAGGGSLTDGVQYAALAVWRYTDSLGRVRRSPPSALIRWTQSGVGGRTIRGTLPSSWLNKSSTIGAVPQVFVEIYRTTGGTPTAPGSVFYLETTGVAHPDFGFYSDGRFVPLTLGKSDAVLSGETGDEIPTVLYTQASQEIGSAPPGRFQAYFAGRLAVAGLSDPTELVVSTLSEGDAPIGFVGPNAVQAASYRYRIPEAITALASLDERLLIFSELAVYVLSGRGPDNAGNGEFEQPFRLPTLGGTIHPQSIAEIPAGLLADLRFRLSLLARGNASPAWLGERVRDVTGERRYLASIARQEADAFEVLWFLSGAMAVAYDVRNDQWVSSPFQLGENVRSVAEYDGELFVALESGQLVFEPYSVGEWPALSGLLEYTPIAPSGALGWAEYHEIQMLGVYLGGITEVICEVSADEWRTSTRLLTTNGAWDRHAVGGSDYAVGEPVVLSWTPPDAQHQRLSVRFIFNFAAASEGLYFLGWSLESERIGGRARSFSKQDG